MRRRYLITLAAALLGCGSEDPTKPPFGEELTVAEQVALQAAFGKVADSLDLQRTATDSLIADFTRIAAQLARLEGRYGTITVQLPGGSAPVTMRAVAVSSSDATSSTETLLAWDGLDVATFRMSRALVMQSGGFPTLVLDQIRYYDMTGSATTQGLYTGGGTLTTSAPAFTNNCAGLENTATETCRAGKLTVAGQSSVTSPAGVSGNITWPAAPVAAFQLAVK